MTQPAADPAIIRDYSTTIPPRPARRPNACASASLTSQPAPFKAASRIERILVRGGDASVADDPSGTRTGVEARRARRARPDISQRPTAWLAISDSNFDVQSENSSL